MRKVILFGNSGSGKSTLAKKLQKEGLAHLDLDTLAWDMNPEPVRRPLEKSREEILEFISGKDDWVIEGCYADLLEFLLEEATEVIFLDLPVKTCLENAKNRPWEPHKYESKEAQDQNLSMLLDWITQYPEREDTFSRTSHQTLFDEFSGKKVRYTSNADTTNTETN